MTDNAAAAYHAIKNSIAGRSKADIHTWLMNQDGGSDGVLDLVFAQLPGAFLADRAKGQEIDFQYELDTPVGRRSYFAVVQNNMCRTGSGRIASPSVTMNMDISIFLQVLTGEMLPVRAFLTRKIKVIGDMMAATKFESWFARPGDS